MDFIAFHAPHPDFLEKTDEGYLASLYLPEELKLEQAWLRSEPDNEEYLSPMQLVKNEEGWQIWQGILRLNTAEDITLYCFKLMIAGQQQWLDARIKPSPYFSERDFHFRLNPHIEPARWLWSQVFYQIFPERFYDGDPSNNVKDADYLYEGKPVVAKSWNELPDRRQGPREFYGGDLEGIRQKLDYLQELGVTGLYLNPIFTSPSSHKYDTVDYYDIDPHFGTKETFALLCHDLRTRHMRILLDAVVNHTSERHPWFDRYGEHGSSGAYHSTTSETRDYYVFQSDDAESYHGWYGVKTLPVLDYRSEKLRDIVYRKDDAILRYWMRPPYSIDGWRFDVIHMLGEGSGALNNAAYVKHFRQTLREENPEAFVLGEHFFEASKWLQGDQEDAAMNYYGFTAPLWFFLAAKDVRMHGLSIDAKDFDHLLERARIKLPFEVQLSQFNLLGSHDTPRFLSFVEGDTALMKIAVMLLFTYIGTPCVYYGDEIGLEGLHDPDCRRTFPWDESQWDQDLRHHFKTLIQFRKSSKVLQEGAFISLYAENDVYAFARTAGKKIVIGVINRGEATSLQLPLNKLPIKLTSLQSLFDQQEHPLDEALELKAKSSMVLFN
ncbi:MAG: maltodextrin glucosidase [Trueperaceae bacterium]|nr:maltodextrin glucosidase [Trueperaceae bacterium]